MDLPDPRGPEQSVVFEDRSPSITQPRQVPFPESLLKRFLPLGTMWRPDRVYVEYMSLMVARLIN